MSQAFQQVQQDEAGKLLEYGRSLYEMRRYREAEDMLRKVLARDPQNWMGHYYLGAVLLSSVSQHPEKLHDGLTEAKKAVALGADWAISHFLLSWAYLLSRKYTESLNAAHQGMRLDPEESWGYILVGKVYRMRSEWEKMLHAAQTGLKYRPDETTLLNMQAEALIMLDRKDEAREAVQMALRSDPSSHSAHSNHGWLALANGEHQQALIHFREAMRLEPSSEMARQGLLQSLHARNPLYRLLLGYFLWTRRVTLSEFWSTMMIISGLYRLMITLTRAFPPLALLTFPFILLHQVFSFFTWTADSFFNLLLKLSPTGRLVLSKDESAAANGCGMTTALFLINLGGLVTALLVRPDEFNWIWSFSIGMLVSWGMMIPMAGIYKVHPGYTGRRAILIVMAALLGSSAACGWGSSFFLTPWHIFPLILFLIGWVIYPWIANLIILARD